MDVFSIEIPVNDTEKMAEFNEMMAKVQDETVKYIANLAVELCVSEACASDVYYLRTRSRHTPELEKELIDQYKQGVPVNVMEFGIPC